jgi:hypothetical protein
VRDGKPRTLDATLTNNPGVALCDSELMDDSDEELDMLTP